MVFAARRLTAAETGAVLDAPDQAGELLADESGEAAEDGRLVDLDKSWHGIHCLLTGTAWTSDGPLGDAILGGRPIGEDMGYGPARLLTPDEVREIAAALGGVDRDALGERYSADRFTELAIYPEIWDEDDVLDTYLRPYLDELVQFYADAADDGAAVLLALT